MPSALPPVAIIGMGCMFPKADDLAGYWANIRRGVDAITDIPPTHWRPEDYFDPDPKSPDHTYARRGGFLSPVDFPPLDFGIAPHNLEATDTTQLLGLMVARAALDDAGYGEGSMKPLDRDRVSVILGVTGTLELVIPLGARLGHPIWRRALKASGVPEETADEVVRRIADSYVGWQENSFPGLLGNVAAGRIANRLDLGGTNCVVDAACASSVAALNLAVLELASGRCDLALTGGLDTFNDIFMYMCFSKTPALSPRGDARPFDAGCDGTILGEGLGVLALKRLDDARRDGDKIYAVVRGVGTSSDGKGYAVYAPSASGQVKALREAYRVSGVTPDSVELVEAHGTGTRVGDATELSALNEVFGASRPGATWCALGSVKSQVGHTKAAAGVAGIIKAALSLYHKVLPPTIKVDAPLEGVGPGRSPFYLNTQARPWLARAGRARRAAVSAFGFGGSNFHCVLEEADAAKLGIDWDGSTQIAAFSADSAEGLKARLDDWPEGLSWSEFRTAAARTRARFRAAEPHRLVIVVDRNDDLAANRSDVLTALANGPKTRPTPGVFLGAGPVPGGLGMLFPGQGSQYAGMLRELACLFPQMQEALAEADSVVSPDGPRVSERVYPFPAFSDAERAAQDAALRATETAQPAIGAVSLGLFRVLEHFGVRPDAIAGHSFGELTALRAAGRLNDASFARLACVRGRLMADQAARGGGGMLAVFGSIAVLEEVLRSEGLGIDLVIANRNGPRQFVLSGPEVAIERAARAFERRKVMTRALAVSAAFHSPAVAEASGPFLAALNSVEFAPASIPVYANTTAAPYPADPAEARSLLAGQLANPVAFSDELEAMRRAGVSTFLEVGPDAKLSGLVRATLGVRAIALDASKGAHGNLFDLAAALAELASIGYPVVLTRWDEGRDVTPRSARKSSLTVKVCGANASTSPRPAAGATPNPTTAARPLMTPTPPPRPRPIAPPVHPLVNGDASAHPDRNGHADEHAIVSARAAENSQTVPAAHPAMSPRVAIRSSNRGRIAEALRTAQENLLALQKLSAQTAELHKQFLEGQDRTQRTFQSLLEQHQRLTLAAAGAPTPRQCEAPAEPDERLADSGGSTGASPSPMRLPARPERPSEANGFISESQGSPVVAADETRAVLLDVIASKTGYPVEMLELAMRLDADLGIDSIKRVEILSALQEQLPDVPAIKPEQIGAFNTIQDILIFLRPNRASAVPVPERAPSAIEAVLLEAVADKTGYPAEMLEPGMRLDADLGIDSIKRVEILSALQERLPDAPAVKPEQIGALVTLGDIVEFLDGASGPGANGVLRADTVALVDAPLQRWVVRSEPIAEAKLERPRFRAGAEVWVLDDGSGLAAIVAGWLETRGARARIIVRDEIRDLTVAGRLDALVLLASPPLREPTGQAVKDAFRLLRLAGPSLRRTGRETGARLVTVTRLDGAFGTIGQDFDHEAGALAGLAKTASHEWPEVRCKAIDLDPALEDPAEALVDELLRAGPIEVGMSRDGRSTLGLAATPIEKGSGSAAPIGPGDVIVVTGGARGVTAEVAVALAEAFRPTLVLLGRTPAPNDEPQWLAALEDEAEIKRALASRANGHATPHLIGEQFHAISAGRAVQQTLARIEAAGSKAVYQAVDVRDREAVRSALDAVRSEIGPIRGLVHGAGVLADRKLEDLTDAGFGGVYDTKVAGLRNTADACDDLRLVILFSSITARFGRTGQAAYAAANEALNAWARREVRRRPQCRVVAVNWGPWDGGMVTPSLKTLFASEGVGLIGLKAGARYLVDEITAADRPAEVVVLGGRSLPDGLVANPAPILEAAPLPRPVARVSANLKTVFERPLDLEAMPILRSHVIDGRAVVPMALMLEWLAQGAVQRNPGLAFRGVDALRVVKGAVLNDDRREVLAVLVGKATRDGAQFRVPVELRGTLADGASITHATAEVVLADRPLQGAPALPSNGLASYSHAPREVYHDILFHGPDLHGLERIDGLGAAGVSATSKTGPAPTTWFGRPLRQGWLADPLALDSAFQLMCLWCHEQTGAVSLPTALGRYTQFRRAFPEGRVRIVARATRPSEYHARADYEFLDLDGGLVARIDGYECMIDRSLLEKFRRNRLPHPHAKARAARGSR